MTDTIKITTLSQMGTTIPGPTLVPVVDMSGVPTTKKATVANIANAILSQAGNGYAYAAKANLANTAGSAGTVSNASQPNITSVGTLTSLAVSGTTNLGPVGNVTITGGTVGQVLTTNGSNVLSWSTVASGGNATPAGSNTQLQFNDGGAFGASANLTFNKTTNNLTLAGNVITQSGVYSNIISSIGNSNIELWVNHPTGFSYVFTIGGALQIPGGHLLESNGNGAFELKSGNGIVISSDIGNTNQSFSFRTDGVFHAPGNVELEGTRLSVGPGASNVTLEGATVVVNANSNVYVQAALTNENPNGSADWTAYGTNGDDTGGWTDFGFTGYNFNDANYTITGPGDGYLFAHAYANGIGGGNLVIATGDHGTHNDIIFATNGFATGNIFGRISDANNAFELTRANSAIKFADGTIQTTAYTGGNANTGNVTFNDQIILGTGSNDGSGGLYLAPGNASIANSAVQYLRVRGGDVPTHIHLDTGNNEFYDQYFGDDGKFVKLEAGGFGNVVIGTVDIGNNYNWSFTSDGNLILASGNSVIFSTANSSLDPLNPNVSTMTLTPDQSYIYQALVLDPTSPGHIHLRAVALSNIDDPSANLFLGGENTAFEITYGSNNEARIHSGGNTWTFDNTGNLIFPRDAVGNIDPILSIVGGATPTIVSTDASLTGPANLAIQSDYLNLSGSTGNRIAIYADNGEIGTEANMVLYTNLADPGNIVSWILDTTGNLTLPDTTSVIANASITLEANSTGNITGLSVNGDADANLYAHGNVTIVSDSSNTTATWSFVNTGDIVLPNDVVIGDDGSNGMMLSVPTVTPGTYSDWTFDQSGNLVLPEGGIVTNNIPPVTFTILYQYDDLVWSGNTLTFTNASSTYMLGVLALMEVGDTIILGSTSTTVTGVYTGGSAGTFTVSGTGVGQQIAQFTLPNRLPSVNGIKLTTNAKNYLFTEAGVTQSPVLTVDTLPSGQYAIAGFRAFVSDANLAPVGNFGAIVGNSGANTVCVWSDGTNWRIG